MSLLKRLFSINALIRSLQVFVAIAAVYFLIAVGLIFWPSPAPFADGMAALDSPQAQEPDAGADASSETDVENIAVETRDGEVIFAHRYEASTSTSIILMHGIASDSSAFENAARLLRESTGAEVITPDFRGHGRSVRTRPTSLCRR